MAETTAITFDFKEVAELLVKKHGIHDGLWTIYVEFGIGAANVGPSPQELRPAAIIPVVKFGIQRVNESTNLTVDAAAVNPAPGFKAKLKAPASAKRSKRQAGESKPSS
jgi:hypothetical protein